MTGDGYTEAARLVLEERWAAIATLNEGVPLASMVAYACQKDLSALYIHISHMALHTKNLLEFPRASIVVGRPDDGTGDPQTLPRISLSGQASPLEDDTPAFDHARDLYLARFPAAEIRFQLPDFVLFRFEPAEARWVGGFARALRIDGAKLSEAARHLAV